MHVCTFHIRKRLSLVAGACSLQLDGRVSAPSAAGEPTRTLQENGVRVLVNLSEASGHFSGLMLVCKGMGCWLR